MTAYRGKAMWLGHFGQSGSLIFSGIKRPLSSPRHHFLPRPVLAAAVALTALHIPGVAGAQIMLSVDDGNAADPLVSARPLFNFPNEVQVTTVTVRANPFGPQFTGPVRLPAICQWSFRPSLSS
jgi:hypothetical protein